jgi:hypothetical protein
LESPLPQNNEVDETQPVCEACRVELKFTKELDPNERKHYEMIVRAQRDSIASLRKQLMESLAEIDTLKK